MELPDITRPPPGGESIALRDAAQKLEAAFLAEMLRAAGLGRPPEGLGGGTGEAQFASLLVEQQAEQMARAGGIGLSEVIFAAMTRGQADAGA